MKIIKYILSSLTSVMLAGGMVSCSVDEEGLTGSFPYLEITTKDTTLTKVEASTYIKYNSNRAVGVRISSACNWLTASMDGEYIVLHATENPLEEKRSTSIEVYITNDLLTHNINVVQDASGELTFSGDLTLESKSAIAQNTYTKVLGSLLVGNFSRVQTKADNAVSIETHEHYLTANPSDIDDDDIAKLTEQIHLIEDHTAVILNTKASLFPYDLVKNNEINALYFDYNELSSLPSASEFNSLNIFRLTLKGNKISDISPLTGSVTLTHLDISETDVYDLNPLLDMVNLEYVNLSGLPLTQPQVEIFKEQFKGEEVIADNLLSSEAPIPVIEKVEVLELSDTQVQLTARISRNSEDVSKVGFYIGDKKLIKEMTEYECSLSDDTFTMTYDVPTLLDTIYHVRAFADNAKGRGYSSPGYIGSLISEEDLHIRNKNELDAFGESTYTHVYGSVFIGNTSTGSGIHLDSYNLYFGDCDGMNDLSGLGGLTHVSNGLYIGNVKLQSADAISHIAGLDTLWLKGNRLTSLPELASDETLTYLNISMNKLSDLKFIQRMPNLTHLYLGESTTTQEETNEIYDLNELADYPNLKFIEISGLPLHNWQVDRLREAMPQTTIKATLSSRTPYIPDVITLKSKTTSKGVTLRGQVNTSGNNAVITEYGFYYGKSLDNMEKVAVGENVEIGKVFTHSIEVYDDDIYYFRAYAVNQYGESWCDTKTFTTSHMELDQDGTSNCYIVPGQGRYRFNATVKGNSTESIGTPSGAMVLWQMKTPEEDGSFITSINLNDGYLEFEIGEHGEYGNALIAVTDVYNNILWSWHIWICDFEPEETMQVYSNGAVMMDRNLGATMNEYTSNYQNFRRAEGLFYQWGRKDPFTQGHYTTRNSSFNYVSEISVVPTEFVTSNPWINSGGKNMWKKEEKSIYDPCPAGWKIPENNAFTGITRSTGNEYGCRFTYNGINTTYYPSSSYISDWGEMNRETDWIRLWTCENFDDDSAYSTQGYTWGDSFYSDWSNINLGFNVRCSKFENFGIPVAELLVAKATEIEVKGDVEMKDFTNFKERGFVWSTNNDDLTKDSANTVSVGGGEGSFTATISGLNPQTKYYIRPYVIGKDVIRYGEYIEVRTLRTGLGDQFTEDEYEW